MAFPSRLPGDTVAAPEPGGACRESLGDLASHYRRRPDGCLDVRGKPAAATDDPATLPKQDVVIVTLKAHALPGLAAQIDALLAPQGEAHGWIERGSARLKIVPLTDQLQFDRLLWACDVNFVRGEDSCVRAQWAQRPLVWNIYPQAENTHWIKLHAFLDRFAAAARLLADCRIPIR